MLKLLYRFVKLPTRKANISLQEEETFFVLFPNKVPDIQHVPICVFLQIGHKCANTIFVLKVGEM